MYSSPSIQGQHVQRHCGVEQPGLFELLQLNMDGQDFEGSSQEGQFSNPVQYSRFVEMRACID